MSLGYAIIQCHLYGRFEFNFVEFQCLVYEIQVKVRT